MAERSSKAFERLHPKVQHWIWQQGWTELRDAQEEAVDPILAGDRDVIIAANTASGKTEAVFLPIATRLALEPDALVLYVSPLKALINDQHSRLEPFFAHLDLPTYPWHGDIAATRKKRFRLDPRGVLLITPESLEAMFVSQGFYLDAIFRNLKYAVIDELHSFIGTERGRQLQSLLHRLEVILKHRVPRIALSATLGDMSLAAAHLRPGDPTNVRLIVSKGAGQEIKLLLRGYEEKRPEVEQAEPAKADEDEGADGGVATSSICSDLFKTLRGSNNLVFANSRRAVELYADRLRCRCESARLPVEFWPHHGSLSKDLREHVESVLKDRSRPATAICTSTLELGIDIGTVKSVAQIGTPSSVASLRQRLGRSGRRGEPAILRIYIQEPEITERSSPVDSLRTELVQAIAVVRLLLSSWCEPPNPAGLHLSTLVHQVLSFIAQDGGITATQGWKILCRDGPFRCVEPDMFVRLLRGIAAKELILQSSDGTLLLAPLGEKIVNHYSFYTVFVTPEEYRVLAGDRELGTLPVDRPLRENCLIILAGRRWRVVGVDDRRKVIEVVRAAGGRVPMFGGQAGRLHDRIRKEMLAVLSESDMPPFLDPKACELLLEGRENFHRFRLNERSIVSCGADTLLFLWAGDRIVDTIAVQFQALGFSVMNEGVALQVADIEPALLLLRLAQIVAEGPADPVILAGAVENKLSEKYDAFLPDDLLCENYGGSRLDAPGAWETLRQVIDGS